MNIARRAEAIQSPDGRPFISVPSGTGILTFPVYSTPTRNFLLDEAFLETDAIPSPQTITAAVRHLAAQSERTPGTAVFFRTGQPAPDRLCLDLSTPHGDYVEITPEGFRTTAGRGVRFEFSPAFRANFAPLETQTGDPLAVLRDTLHIPAGDDWLRLLAWLLTALHPAGPFPILILRGPSGCGKSFAARVLRAIVDPVTAPLAAPGNVRQLLVLARTHWIVALDHVRRLTPALTDALCRLSTGFAVPVREPGAPDTCHLWTKRPILLTVPDTCELPPEIAERAFCVTLAPLTDRRPEPPMLDQVTGLIPAILGALCAALSRTLAAPPEPNRAYPTRFPLALALAESAFPGLPWVNALNAPALHLPLHEFIHAHPNWRGTATDLLDQLPGLAPTPRALSALLRRSPGIRVKFRRTHGGARYLSFASPPDSPANNELHLAS